MKFAIIALVFILSSISFKAQACAELFEGGGWQSATEELSQDKLIASRLQYGLSPTGMGFAIFDLTHFITPEVGRELFDLVSENGRHTVFQHRTWSFESAISQRAQTFLQGFTQAITQLINARLRGIEPKPLMVRSVQIRRYNKGVYAAAEHQNGSENPHVDGSAIYLRVFSTPLGVGLRVHDKRNGGLRVLELARGQVCAFSGGARKAAGLAPRQTMHQGRTVNGCYDEDRISIVIDMSPED